MKLSIIICSLLTLVLGISMPGLADTECKGGKKFEKKDTNNDGVISQDEFVSAKMNRFDTKDTNKDGTITKAEAKASAQENFKKLDTDNDGKVTQEEMKAYWQSKHKAACS